MVERELECRERLKNVAEEVPVERCHMAPEDHCRQVVKVLPRLALEQRCVDTPREDCTTITLPKTVKRPVVKETCVRQGEQLAPRHQGMSIGDGCGR